MKNIKYLIITFIFLLIPLGVKAETYCTTNEKIRLTKLASNVTSGYDYTESNGTVNFSITIYNVHSDLIIRDSITNKEYKTNKSGLRDITINNLKDGTSYSFNIYSKIKNCTNILFYTIYVNIPKYNKYYSDPVCNEAKDYLLCQKWAEIGNINYDEFKNQVNDYKKTNVISEEKKGKEDNWIYKIGNFWAQYYMYILGSIILVCLPIIIIKNKKDKVDF